MAEATQDKPKDALDEPVARLVDQMLAAASKPDVEESGGTLDRTARGPTSNGLGGYVDRMVNEAGKSNDLNGHIDRMVTEAAAIKGTGKTVMEATAPPRRPGIEAIETLDEQLAATAEDVIEGDFADESGAPLGATPARPAPAVPMPAPPGATPPPPPLPPVVKAPVAAPEAAPPEPPPSPQVAPSEPPAVPKGNPLVPASSILPPRPETTAPAPKPSKRNALLELVLPLMVAVSKPLKGRSRFVHDVVGYAALISAFWAMVFWGWLIFVRDPSAPERPASTTAAAKADSKDHAAAKEAPKKAAEKKAEPKKAAGGH